MTSPETKSAPGGDAPERAASASKAGADAPTGNERDNASSEGIGLRAALTVVARMLPIALLGAAIGLGVTELGLRLAGLPQGSAYSVRAAYDLDDETVGPYMAGSSIDITWPPETAFEAHFNSLGCRGAEPRRVAAPAILAVGDSLTFGLGVEDDRTWPANLDRLLHERGTDRPVVNLSSAFLMIDDEIRYLERALPVVKPGLVILMLPPTGDGGFFDSKGRTQHQIGFEREREARSRVGGFLRELALSEARFYVKVWRQRQRLEGRGEYPPRITPVAGTHVAPLPHVVGRYVEGVEEFKRIVEASGATLVIANFPQTVEEDGAIRFEAPWSADIPKKLGAEPIDIASAFNAQPDGMALTQLPHDAHASALGNAVVAETLLDALVERGLVN